MSKGSQLTPDNVGRMVMLAYGYASNKNPFWCYLSVKPSEYEHLQKLVKNQKLDLRSFEKDGLGEIIVSGEGAAPPVDVTKTVASMFNVSIRDLFRDVDPNSAIAKEIERLKQENGE